MPKHTENSRSRGIGLGNAILNDRDKKRRNRPVNDLHVADFITSEAAHAAKLKSVIERNDLDDYLATSLSAQNEFEAIKQQHIVSLDDNKVILRPTIKSHGSGVSDNIIVLIPRRTVHFVGPKATDQHYSAEQLDEMEKDTFLKWRKRLADMEEKDGFVMTPFEKNLEFWRQLWRVVERSDILIEILDGRNPLFFRSRDLEAYVKEVDPKKGVIVLVNKADFMPRSLRLKWAEFFKQQGVEVIFFSALRELHEQGQFVPPEVVAAAADADRHESSEGVAAPNKENTIGYGSLEKEEMLHDGADVVDSDELIAMLQERRLIRGGLDQDLVVGMVGYPNVGKSSVINALCGSKKVSVSRQPGKTKHFQTLPLASLGLTLCDCPGLVFPSVVATKSHLLINGVIPVDHFRGDFMAPVQIICDKISEKMCETYGVAPPVSCWKRDELRRNVLDAYSFLSHFAVSRRYIAQGRGGLPDIFKVSKMVVRDYCTGRLLHCEDPPLSKEAASSSAAVASLEEEQLSEDERVPDDLDFKGLVLEKKMEAKQSQAPGRLTKRAARMDQKASIKGFGSVSVNLGGGSSSTLQPRSKSFVKTTQAS